MKKIFATIAIAAIIAVPVLTFAHGDDDGHDENATATATTTESSMVANQIQIQPDGTFAPTPQSGGFKLAQPLSGKWWMLVGISLMLMGILSIQVEKYLKVE